MSATSNSPTRFSPRAWMRNKLIRQLVGVLFVAGIAVFGVYTLNGQRSELSGSVSLVENSRLVPIAVAIVAEFASVASFGAFNWYLLRVGLAKVPLGRAVAVSLAATTINNSVPGGTAFASVYSYREYRAFGADSVFATWVVLANNLLSGVALAILAMLGVAASINTSRGLGLFIVVPVLAISLVGLAALISAPKLLIQIAGPILRIIETRGPKRFRKRFTADLICSRLTSMHPTRLQVLIAVALTLSNWIFDASVLVLAYVAIHQSIPWRGLLLAYGAGQLAANLPITPGGLGVVEGSLSIALVAYGGGQESAVAAVLIYRLVSFWMVIPFGWSAYLATSFVRKRDTGSELDKARIALPAKDSLQ